MKKKIFVAENDASIREIVTSLLTDEGYNVKAVSTEDRVFEEIELFKPHVILLDIIKPTEKGTEICRTLKADSKTKNIPVIVLSTHHKVAETIKNVCADEVIPKPFDIYDLLNSIELQLSA
jgi:DNA-binding response OmpR family regulator